MLQRCSGIKMLENAISAITPCVEKCILFVALVNSRVSPGHFCSELSHGKITKATKFI